MKRQFFMVIVCVLFQMQLQAQISVAGVLTDAYTGEALIGATVTEVGTSNGTFTDYDGSWSLDVAGKNSEIEFSYIGYYPQTCKVGDSTMFKIALRINAVAVEAVVATGYMTVKKEDVTSAVTIVSGDEIADRPVVGKKGGLKRKTAEVRERSYSSSSEVSDEIVIRGRGTVVEEKFDAVYEDIAPVDAKYEVEGSGAAPKESTYKAGTLTAGEINDFSKWELWNDKSQEELYSYKDRWHILPEKRFSVIVQNRLGFAVPFARVELIDEAGFIVWQTFTDNIGKAELWANMFENTYENNEKFKIKVYGESETQTENAIEFQQGINHVTLNQKCNVSANVDVVFVVDATGSMGDEIGYLKSETENVISRVKKQNEDIDLHVGCVFYRDKTDEYVTRKSDLSGNISQATNFIQKQTDAGGGDFPEAVDAALDVAINELSWRADSRAKIIFLVLDAPPHDEAENIASVQNLIKQASELGIKIVPITGSGIDKSTEYLMRTFALATNGTYVFLTDDSGVGGSHIKPTTDKFQVEKLNDLLVRLFEQFTSVEDCSTEYVIDEKIQDADSTTNVYGDLKSYTESYTEELHEEKNIKFYPNPTYGDVNLEITGEVEYVYLSDLSGKILQRIKITNEHMVVSIANYPRGVYYITYMNEEEKPQYGKIVLYK